MITKWLKYTMYQCFIRRGGQNGVCNWASEASPTLGCSIEISRDISLSTSKACNFTHPPRTGDAYAREYSMYVGTS